MAELEAVIGRIGPADEEARAEAQRAFDAKTKPRGSLGRLEEIGCRIAAIRGLMPARLEAAIVVAAGDHGVAAEAVSAYPQEVTAQMVANFAAGGAAINVLARQAGARLIVVDAGVAVPFEHELVRALRIGAGTANIVQGPAMTREQAVAAMLAGVELAEGLDGIDVVALGEMGIGNTTSASALASALLEVDAALVCGRGTGLDDEGLARKVDAVRRAVARDEADDPLAALAALGFLTRVPVGRWIDLDGDDVARAGALFPLVGAGIGAAVGGTTAALAGPLSPLLAAGLALAVGALLTGALHLDALADTADAL